jgi:hypothetical protein
VADVAELAVQSLTSPAARNATIPFGGPDEVSQRDAVRLFEEAYGKTFSVIEVPEELLESQWRAAQDPFEKTFAALMLGLARGLGSGINPPFEAFPMRMTSPREYVRRMANASGKPVDSETRQPASATKPADAGQAELR